MSAAGAGRSLGRRVLTGSLWLGALRGARRGVGFLGTIVLARLLMPEDYGLAAVGMLCVALIQPFTELGIRSLLVQAEHPTDRMLGTAWAVELIRGAMIAGVVALLAPWLAAFFQRPDAVPLIRVAGLIPLLTLLGNIRIVEFQRQLDFHKQFAYEFGGALAGLVASVTAAWILRSAWALVLGQVAAAVAASALSYAFFPKAPALRLDRDALAQIVRFGKWIFLGSIVSFLTLEGDKFVVGRWFGTETLGLYQMAGLLTAVVVQEIGKSIAQVFFPAYVQVRADAPRLQRVFLRASEASAALLAPLCLWFALAAPDLVHVVLGVKWLACVPLLRILALAGLLRVLMVSGSGLFYALSQPRLATQCDALRLAALAAGVAVLPWRLGPAGVAWAVVFANGVALLGYAACWRRLLHLAVPHWLPPALTLALALAALAVSHVAVQTALRAMPVWPRLLGAAAVGALAYLGVYALVFVRWQRGPLRTLQAVFTRREALAPELSLP